MYRNLPVLLAAALFAHPAAAQNQPKDPLGLTETQRQMAAWSLAGIARIQPLPQGFEPKIGARIPEQLELQPIPRTVTDEAPAIRNHQYVMLRNKDLLLVNPGDKTIADILYLKRRLGRADRGGPSR